MRTLYLDCFSGISGDMLVGTLLALGADRDAFAREMDKLDMSGSFAMSIEDVTSYGMTGVKFTVQREAHHEAHQGHHAHDHSSLKSIEQIIKGSRLAQPVKDRAMSVFDVIIDAEAQVHGVTREQVHLHEVGSIDAIVDITAAAVLFNMLNIDEVVSSPVNLGGGTVKCAHGIMPVPAPATGLLVKGRTVYGEENMGELTTPTGAALLSLAKEGHMPTGQIVKTGFGFGKKDIGRANCVRGMILETDGRQRDRVAEISANIDDMTGEEIGFAQERLLEEGALDVWTAPIYMKKSRPAVTLHVLCALEDVEKTIQRIFENTTTLGVRWTEQNRSVLDRELKSVDTPYGKIQVKLSKAGPKPEYDQTARAARAAGVPYKAVYNSAVAAVKSLEV